MLWAKRTIERSQASILRRWRRRHYRLMVISGLLLAVGGPLVVTPTQSVPSIMRAEQIEVVNDKGAVVFIVRSTQLGGHLEVRDGTGATIFSAGSAPDTPPLSMQWEQSRQDIARQRRDLERQRRDLNHLAMRLQALERQNLKQSHSTRSGRDFDQYRSALARQDREIDHLERRLSQLSRQLNSLERRQ